ncbi:hypothetical protein F4821DRAFT_251328 [Hypoxylon rubiginosum]|uniref:Uncharacterized protein n=1 Tax=Hypoxylon rubiginosum TaxID=110542 RepID=A0ACC0CJD3_9PEZI|nr:hypothetical protein F4821DRAFT_251328 [Hypoxylon rubiginosum]
MTNVYKNAHLIIYTPPSTRRREKFPCSKRLLGERASASIDFCSRIDHEDVGSHTIRPPAIRG